MASLEGWLYLATVIDCHTKGCIGYAMADHLRTGLASAQRRRSVRTLEALSIALGWHPRHLAAVLKGQRVPDIGEPVSRSDDDVPGRLAAIEYRLAQIETRLGDIGELNDRIEEVRANIEAMMRLVDSSQKIVRG